MKKDRQFSDAKKVVMHNLEAVQSSLIACVEEGMIDTESVHYNAILDLLEDARLLKEWSEMEELIAQAKTLELDIASYLSRKGRTSVSYRWPTRPATQSVVDTGSTLS